MACTQGAAGAATLPATSFQTSPALPSQTSPSLSSTAPVSLSTLAPASFFTPTVHNTNIHTYIDFKLDPAANNYHRWRTLFRFVLAECDALDHIDEEAEPDVTNPDWLKTDLWIVLWIYSTIVGRLADVVITDDGTALATWIRIRDYFLANKAAQGIHLTRKYRNLRQGNMSIADYGHELKMVTDPLADVGMGVSDKDLTIQMLQGLHEDFETIGTVLGDLVPLPSFDVALSRLDLKEKDIKARPEEKRRAVLIAQGGNSTGGDPRGHRAQQGGGYGGDRGDRGDRAQQGGYGGDRGFQQGGRGGGRGGGGQQGGGGGYNNSRGHGRGRGRGDGGCGQQ